MQNERPAETQQAYGMGRRVPARKIGGGVWEELGVPVR